MPKKPETLHTQSELARLLRRADRTVGEWVRTGQLTPAGLGRFRRPVYRLSDAKKLSDALGRHPDKAADMKEQERTNAPPLDPNPTNTIPGSPERIEVYRRRVAKGYAVFCPGDFRYVVKVEGSDRVGERRAATAHIQEGE